MDHSLWNAGTDDAQGNRLVDAINEFYLLSLNDGRPTSLYWNAIENPATDLDMN